jgi:salicylate biosynthesis isochorismate synthase
MRPADLLPRLREEAAQAESFYWEQPSFGFAIAALGRVHAIDCAGGERFSEASRRSRSLYDDLSLLAFDATGAVDSGAHADSKGPLLVGGFAFEAGEVSESWQEFGCGSLVLPELLYVVRGREAWCTLCLSVGAEDALEPVLDSLMARLDVALALPTEPASSAAADEREAEPEVGEGPEYSVRADRTHERYRAQVRAALTEIEAGRLSKVVLARSLAVRHPGRFDLQHFLTRLREIYPSCAVLAVRRAESCFVSASPERLVALSGEAVETAAVAGSAARGRNPEEEQRLGATLLGSEKERDEHQAVKRAIRVALSDVCDSLRSGDEPALMKLEGIQHLETPISGRLAPGSRKAINVLDLVGRLHPTPAVGGTPCDRALAWLVEREDLDRGWYAGPVGWVDAKGDGEFRVALRSGLLQGGEARLYAGAGIVAGSRPEQELAETRLKLRALLAPLTEI